MTSLELEERGAYALWQEKWQVCANLKKRFRPHYAPLELWKPAEAECEAAFKRWHQIKMDLYRDANRAEV